MKVVAKSYFDVIGASQDEGLLCEDPSLAVQASKDECDINNIVKKYLRTGELPGQREGIYADLSGFGDLRDMMHAVNEAQQAFMELPAEVRRFFDNDPTKLVEFAQDDRNYDKAVELGLIDKRSSPPAPAPGAGSSPAPQPSAGDKQPASSGPNTTST